MFEHQSAPQIKLNFLSLTEQDFKIPVFRTSYDGRPLDHAKFMRAKLPESENSHVKWKDYLISFENFPESERLDLPSRLNHIVTLRYLYRQLQLKAEGSLKKDVDYFIKEYGFERRVYFKLKQHVQGIESIWLEPYFLKCQGKLGFLIDFRFLRDPNQQFDREVQMLSLSLDKTYKSNKNFYIDRYRKLESFFKSFAPKLFPLETKPNLSVHLDLQSVRTESLSAKRYVFSGEKTDSSQFMGLQKYGPLVPVEGTLHIPVICQRQDAYYSEQLIRSLSGEAFPTFKGFSSLFRIPVKFYRNPLDKISIDSVQDLIERMYSFKSKGNSLVPIVILDSDEDPRYFSLKYHFLKRHVPFQVVTRTLLANKWSLKWSVSNIALQIFSKAKGIPWKVSPSHQKSLIFGLGQAHHKNEDGTIQKFFAYSVCTDSSGIYRKIDVLGRSSSKDEYLKQLQNNVLKIVRDAKSESAHQVVFHIPFKIKTDEIERIHEALKVESEGDADTPELIVFRVNDENKYFGYADTNSLVPYESSYINLSTKEHLIWFEGMQLHRENILKRVAGPLYVELYWSSKELERREKVAHLQDLLNLSGTNWRGFNSKTLPISIYYCQLISKYLAQFPEEIENVQDFPEPWFL